VARHPVPYFATISSIRCLRATAPGLVAITLGISRLLMCRYVYAFLARLYNGDLLGDLCCPPASQDVPPAAERRARVGDADAADAGEGLAVIEQVCPHANYDRHTTLVLCCIHGRLQITSVLRNGMPTSAHEALTPCVERALTVCAVVGTCRRTASTYCISADFVRVCTPFS